MKKQILIIGLGQIGSSIGMALGEHTDVIERIGYDRDPDIARQSRNLGAVDEIVNNPGKAASKSDFILLSVPMDGIQEVMEEVVPQMKEGAVLMDTALVKRAVASWAKPLLPEGCSYVGLTPVINPEYLHIEKYGVDAASPDLFQNGLMAIAAPPGAGSAAIKVAADLTRLLGASPLFADLMEVDGLMTSTHVVPQLMGAALLNATVDQPGWREARKLAGRAYAEVSGPIEHLGEPGALASTVLLNRENVVRVLDSVIASLHGLRNDIAEEDAESLSDRLERAREGRNTWWKARQAADWVTEEMPKVKTNAASDVFGSLLRFGKRPKRKDE